MSSHLVEVTKHRLREVTSLTLRHGYLAKQEGAPKLGPRSVESVVIWFEDKIHRIALEYKLSRTKLVSTPPSTMTPIGDVYLDKFPYALYHLFSHAPTVDNLKPRSNQIHYYFSNVAEAYMYTNRDKPEKIEQLENALVAKFDEVKEDLTNYEKQPLDFSIDLNSYEGTINHVVVYDRNLFPYLNMYFKAVIIDTLMAFPECSSIVLWTETHDQLYGDYEKGIRCNTDVLLKMLHSYSLNEDIVKRIFIKWAFQDDSEEHNPSSELNMFITSAYEAMQKRAFYSDSCLNCSKRKKPINKNE